MAEFKITRFRYTWKGNWAGDSTLYYKDDVVYHRGSSYVCIRQHTASVFDDDQTFTNPGETFASPAWSKMADGRQFLGQWTSGVTYDTGVLILAGGNVYLCIDSHVSSVNFSSDILNWEVFAVGSNFRNTWSSTTRYRVGDVVRYNGYTYQCVLEHTSSSVSDGVTVGNNDADDDSTLETWKVQIENYTFVGSYQSSTIYRQNDLVKYGGTLLKCITQHTSSSTVGSIDSTKFEIYLPGYEYDDQWSASAYYAVGDIVRQGGTLYIAVENSYNFQPGLSLLYPEGNSKWAILHKAINYKGEYDPQSGSTYYAGDLIRRGGSLWLSKTDTFIGDDSTLANLDPGNWELIIPAYNFRGSWRVDQVYNLYDVIYFRGAVYYANIPHVSDFNNFPGDNGEGINYWETVIISNSNAALTNLGDLITYNLTREIIEDGSTSKTIGDGSTLGPTSVPVGTNDQVLVVENNQGDLGYKTWGNIQRVFHVRQNGVDDNSDPDRGINYFKPFRTIKYALEQADDNFSGHTTIKVATGEYQEILPMIIPRRTAVVGEELRSTTIRANEPIAAYADTATYFIDGLIRIGLLLSNIIQGQLVDKTPTNPEIQQTVLPSTAGAASTVNLLWAEIVSYINFKINDDGEMPESRGGTNTASTDATLVLARNILDLNRNFIKEEVVAFTAAENPALVFDADHFRREVDKILIAVIYDLEFPGNYKSLFAARYYSNAALGSQLDDMFYVRDTSGLRNCTLKGLEGTLPALQAGQTYRIPTGGAFVSLDPGWGPNDERTWILNRSCYVQNVTTFGTAAIGQKVDGLLHNGGNRSIVSNDFTQVISDGIGAWVQNGGRVELVSVFTYYAHIGMFAKNGGIIRATNGNSSYGDFGAVADNIDPDETVKYGYLNTRTEQAIVDSAFAGEINDFILGLEFRHCGQNYTTAEYSITSSGTGAVAIQEEFRDNAMFECQVLSSGSGFNQYGNQAQLGNTTSITLASSETVEEADILGMRVILISGEGTGQYGYVNSYNPITKVVQVRRESDDQPGWDNILSGTPSNPLLTTGTRYRIEPRPIFSAPTYTAFEHTIDIPNSWAAAVYGETSELFTDVAGTAGTGTTIELTPFAALFDVTKNARKYTVVLADGGAGYQTGDEIIIDGADVGGISEENDIFITVTSVSEDSTNSILTFTVRENAIAASGKFILSPSSGHFARYSNDAVTWTAFDLPTDGNWKGLAAGNNRFVAVSRDTANAAYSTNGVTWTASSMPSTRNWNSVIFGKPTGVATGVFLAVADNLNSGAYSTTGATWTATTLPTFGDSTINQWVDVTFGNDKFVAVANSNNIAAVGTWNGTSFSWQGSIMDVIGDSTQKDWVSITYGNRRFVAISSQGNVAYSFDGLEWYAASMPSQDGSTAHNWTQIRYGNGVFFAVGNTGGLTVGDDVTTGPTTYAATSYDGIVWTSRTLATEEQWGVVAAGNPDVTLGDSTASNSIPTFVVAPITSSSFVNRIRTGARALGRVVVEGSGISRIKIWEPGSGYDSDPTLTVVDPNKISDPTIRPRLADGVLAQPTFTSKGSAYKTSTTFVTVNGDGFADITPNGNIITLDGLSVMPGPGAQFYIAGMATYFTAVIVGINEILLPDGTIRSTFQISPRATLANFFEHGMEVLIRERYSQVRITGHDFLDIGTGNFEETNYPELYKTYLFDTEPFQEVQNLNGGRVFYTSTDQDGNFRAGELFAVEQATGIITISAEFFDLRGLTELRLGGILVGSTAVVREFSKDGLFLQNSNNIIPTQRAVRSYLQSRLNVGGEDLLTPSFIAGTVKVGPNLIDNSAGLTVDVPVVADFYGSGVGISGSIAAQTMFFRSFIPRD